MGLLDSISEFIKTPEGQGILSAAFTGMATAQRGAPINSIGKAGVGGLLGYSKAIDRQDQMAENAIQNKIRNMQLAEMERGANQRTAIQTLAKNSVLSPEQQAIGKFGPTNEGAAAIGQFKPQFDQEAFLNGMMGIDPLQAITMRQSMTPKPLTVGKNDRVMLPDATSPTGYKTVLAAQPDLPTGMRIGNNGQWEYDPNYLSGQKAIRAAGKSTTNTNVFNNTKDDFKNERDLRNDFAGLPTTKAFNEVQSAYDQIKVAIQKESPAGDLAAATKIMKILDPGSVVRESELGMAMQANGLMDRVENYANMIITGQKLTPQQRKDFGDLAEQLYTAAAGRYDASADEYRGIAEKYKLNPDVVAKRSKRSVISTGGWSATKKD